MQTSREASPRSATCVRADGHPLRAHETRMDPVLAGVSLAGGLPSRCLVCDTTLRKVSLHLTAGDIWRRLPQRTSTRKATGRNAGPPAAAPPCSSLRSSLLRAGHTLFIGLGRTGLHAVQSGHKTVPTFGCDYVALGSTGRPGSARDERIAVGKHGVHRGRNTTHPGRECLRHQIEWIDAMFSPQDMRQFVHHHR